MRFHTEKTKGLSSTYHFFQLLLWQGLFFGDLIKLGYKGLLATIEMGADGKKIKPFVNLYTKKELMHHLKNFNIDDIFKQLENKLGWYIVFKVQKPYDENEYKSVADMSA
jgi:hypothetical protein